jgi:hypothetical protein
MTKVGELRCLYTHMRVSLFANRNSVFPDPDPDPLSEVRIRILIWISTGSFLHQAKIVRKTLISSVLFCDFFVTFLIREE